MLLNRTVESHLLLFSFQKVNSNLLLSSHTVTPSGSRPTPPQEHQEGDAGFAVMFPSMDGVQIKPFHFCKKTISPTALKEAGLVDLKKKKGPCIPYGLFSLCRALLAGLVDNPQLRVVLIFVYEAYQPGGARFLRRILDPLAKSKALIAGGIVENVFSPPRTW